MLSELCSTWNNNPDIWRRSDHPTRPFNRSIGQTHPSCMRLKQCHGDRRTSQSFLQCWPTASGMPTSPHKILPPICHRHILDMGARSTDCTPARSMTRQRQNRQCRADHGRQCGRATFTPSFDSSHGISAVHCQGFRAQQRRDQIRSTWNIRRTDSIRRP